MAKLMLLIICFSLQAGATALGQEVSMSVKDAPLKTVMRNLCKQTGYGYLFEGKVSNDNPSITINLKQTPIAEALHIIFKDQPIEYEIDGKMIILKAKSVLEKASDFFSVIDLRGKVTDELGNSLPGATVKAGGKVAVTDTNGIFNLSGIPVGADVDVSYVGYEIAKLKATGSFMIVQLLPSASNLKEIIVNKGYYKQDRITNTGSVGTLYAADIAKQPVSDPLFALQGRIPGLYIQQSSGVPGANVRVNLRGRNSIANGLEPLYIVDGVPFNSASLSQVGNSTDGLSPFTNIRPEDIETIDVLKDADATAIYGSRGANGVILITTKKGKAGKTKLDVNMYSGQSRITRKLKLMNTQQYLEMRDEALKNDGKTPESFEYDVNGTWSRDRYTDWQDVMLGGTATGTNANAAISGGTAMTQYLVGGSFRRETTVFPGDYSNTIGSGNFNLNHQSENGRFQLNLITIYANNMNRIPLADFTQFIFMAPNAPAIYTSDGQLNWEKNTFSNPFGPTLRRANVQSENLNSSLTLSYRLVDGLSIKTNLGYNTSNVTEKNITPFTSFKPNTSNPANNRISILGKNANKTWLIEPQLTYHKKSGPHTLDALIGSTLQKSSGSGNVQTAKGFSSDALLENLGQATTVSSSSSFRDYRYNALFARLGYNYKEKYIANLTGRRDGSSRFGPGKQFGNFGALGIAWVFSKEHAIAQALRFMSLGKLRASIGRTGNDQIGDYQFLSTYSAFTGYFGVGGLYPRRLANSDFRWETIDKKEAAVELGFFDNRILLNAAYFQNRTANQLVGYSQSYVTGFATVIANFPATIQNTGFEFDISSQNISKKKFSWSTSVNLTIPRNKLLAFPNIKATSYGSTLTIGQSLSSALRYSYTGIDTQTGQYTVADIDKSGTYSLAADGLPVFVGQRWYGGLSNALSYRGLLLDFFFQFVKQKGYKVGTKNSPGVFTTAGVNVPVQYTERWRKPGDKARYARYTTSGTEDYVNYTESDDRVVDASFIRLKNVSLSYSVPQRIVGLKNMRVYAQCQNLFTITSFDGMDPENSNQNGTPSLPPLRTITVGLNLSL